MSNVRSKETGFQAGITKHRLTQNQKKIILGHITYIDKTYKEFRERNSSRFSIGWGKWSHQFNRKLRALIDSDHKTLSNAYKLVYLYWSLTSNILELKYRGGLINKFKSRKLDKERLKIKRAISNGSIFQDDRTMLEIVASNWMPREEP